MVNNSQNKHSISNGGDNQKHHPQQGKDQQQQQQKDQKEKNDILTEEEEDLSLQLKLNRLEGYLKAVFKKDVTTAFAPHSKFLALGTEQGEIYLLDFQGNKSGHFRGHDGPINDLCVSVDSEYIASCSNQGKIMIHKVWEREDPLQFQYNRPVLSVALDPEFSRKSSRPFVSGGKAGYLILNTKGWFTSKDVVLQSAGGTVHAVKWCGNFVVLATNRGVVVIDMATQQSLAPLITVEHTEKEPAHLELFRCCIEWSGTHRFVVGWNRSIRVVQILEQGPTKSIEIVSRFEVPYYVSGITFYQNDQLLVLSHNDDQHLSAPDLRILTLDGKLISSNSLHRFINVSPQDRIKQFNLVGYEKDEFYIVSPRSIIKCRSRDWDEKIEQLLQQKKYYLAYRVSVDHRRELRKTNVADVGKKYLNQLITQRKFSTAAEQCPSILEDNKELWEEFIYTFQAHKRLKDIVPYVPISSPVLKDSVYEAILGWLVQQDKSEFLNAVEKWPPDIYNVDVVIKPVVSAIERNNVASERHALKLALAKLYEYKQQYDKALVQYLELRDKKIFDFIENFKLFKTVKQRIFTLMELEEDKTRALNLLVENVHHISVKEVVDQLQPTERDSPEIRQKKRYYLHLYLDAMFEKHPQESRDYHGDQVTLYAEFDRDKLLPFLKKSDTIPVDEAFNVCQERQLYNEMVYLLGSMGNNKEALMLIITELQDIRKAVEFIKESRDDELWDDLFEQIKDNPKHIEELLDNVDGNIDPLKFIRKIPPNTSISGLSNKLSKIISDYTLQVTLQQGCRKVLASDTISLSRRLYRLQRRGRRIGPDTTRCSVCGEPVSSRAETDLLVHYHGSVFHVECMRNRPREGKKTRQRK